MDELMELTKKLGLVTLVDNGKIKGNSCNVKAWPVFRLWINKSGNLTVKTRGVQKSFKEWNDADCFKTILRGFEII